MLALINCPNCHATLPDDVAIFRDDLGPFCICPECLSSHDNWHELTPATED